MDKLDGSVGFALPADTELSTIMVSCSGGSINWGGQYDPHTQTVTFDASYSGQYEVLENRVSIADVNTLDAQVQDAIAFLVSKGYMSLNGDLFQPDAPLTRYEFAQALVGMFFALDTSLTTSFQDVPADSPYYAYVASGEAGAIIQGYNASTFGGSDPITMEQMLALAARTLMEHKGYTEPADAVSYLSAFYDGTQVSDWARSQIALAIREGLIDRGGMLAPLDRVSRSEAALILYRLFLLLCEVPTVAPELPPVTDSGEDAALEPSPAQQAPAAVSVILPIAGAVCAIAAGAAAAWWFLVKKKK